MARFRCQLGSGITSTFLLVVAERRTLEENQEHFHHFYCQRILAHGANLTFIVWGFKRLVFFPLLLTSNNRNNLGTIAEGRILPNFERVFGNDIDLWINCFCTDLFRADSLQDAFLNLLLGYFPPPFSLCQQYFQKQLLFLIAIFPTVGMERKGRINLGLPNWEPLGNPTNDTHSITYWPWLFSTGGGSEQQFIYFQF